MNVASYNNQTYLLYSKYGWGIAIGSELIPGVSPAYGLIFKGGGQISNALLNKKIKKARHKAENICGYPID